MALFCHYLAQKSWNWNYEVVEIFPLIWKNLLDQSISKNIKPTIVWHTLYCIMKSLTKCFKIIDNADTNTKYLKVHSKYEKYLIFSKLEISSLSRFRFEWQDSVTIYILVFTFISLPWYISRVDIFLVWTHRAELSSTNAAYLCGTQRHTARGLSNH